ncbi:MAG: DNA-binding domain-containing protein, partial [Polyangiales bacterium]
MTEQETRVWLAALQARFSSVLRTPLDASSGELRCRHDLYPDAACADVLPGPQLSAAARLSLYQRQYWMRLLNVMHDQYPLTVRLLGAFFFNQHALRFLSACPPHSHDLAGATEGFAEFLTADLQTDPVSHPPRGPSLPRLALLEAARLDAAYRRVFHAPEEPRL